MIRALTLLLLLWAMPALAHDGTHDEWFRSLTNRWGGSCCNMTDCKPVVARIRADGQWEAMIDSKTWPEIDGDVLHLHGAAPNDWVTIPDQVVLHGHDNPLGEPILCWYQGAVLCFVPGVEI